MMQSDKKQKMPTLDLCALIFLILFQFCLYFAIVDQNENLLPIKHEVSLNTFGDTPNLILKSNAVGGHQTDSVEIVKDHFLGFDFGLNIFKFGFNIQMQFLLLLIFSILFFVIFWKMGVSPAPFLVPLFIILTISIFYHNYLGHRVTDNISIPSIKSVVCEGNCSSKDDIGIIKCNQTTNERERICQGISDEYVKKIPCDNKVEDKKIICGEVSILKDDEDKYIIEENGRKFVEIVKIDKKKMGNRAELHKALVLGVYAESFNIDKDNKKGYIQFNSEDLNKKDSNISEKDSNINKYVRASWDSKEHFIVISFGLICFLLAMIFMKHFSTVRDLDDSTFRLLILLSIIGGTVLVFVEKNIMHKGDGVTSLGEYAKLISILLTVTGYEKISKNRLNLWLYIGALLLGIGALSFLNDSGNMLILGVIVGLMFLISLPWKKLVLFIIVVLVICGLGVVVGYEKNYNQNMQWRLSEFWNKNMPGGNKPWRIKDTWSVVEKPLYRCEIPTIWGKSKVGGKRPQPFYSTRSNHKICYIKDNETVVGLDMVKNCTETEDKTLKCDLDSDFSNYSKASVQYYDSNNCSDDKDNMIKCGQIDKDPRLAMFAILKDGISIIPAGFKENTFLLNNHYMYTDFVFTGLIAFFGLLVTILVIGCLFILILNCRIKPKHCGNNYKQFLYSNILMIIFATQAIIHIGGNLNIIPFTGVILPFLSRAKVGTPVSFITLGCAIGGLLSDSVKDYKLVNPIWSGFEKIWCVLKWGGGKLRKFEQWCYTFIRKLTKINN